MKKKDLIDILINEYGYERDDLKDENGKLFTNAVLKSMIEKEESDNERAKFEEDFVELASKHKFKDDDQVIIMSGVDGTVIYTSSTTGRKWQFKEFGQTAKIPYSELLYIRNTSKAFDDGILVILNKQIQEEFQLTDIYNNIITPQNIDAIFDKGLEDLDAFIDSLPEAMKATFFTKARQLYERGKIDSVSKVKLIENKFGISLEDNAPLSDIALSYGDKE